MYNPPWHVSSLCTATAHAPLSVPPLGMVLVNMSTTTMVWHYHYDCVPTFTQVATVSTNAVHVALPRYAYTHQATDSTLLTRHKPHRIRLCMRQAGYDASSSDAYDACHHQLTRCNPCAGVGERRVQPHMRAAHTARNPSQGIANQHCILLYFFGSRERFRENSCTRKRSRLSAKLREKSRKTRKNISLV
jgi:hypothetical protein